MGIFTWAGFGVLVRMGQLWILRKPLSYNLPAYGAYMVGFGAAGYWADDWVNRSNGIIAARKESIRQHRLQAAQRMEQEEHARGVVEDLMKEKETMDPKEWREKANQTIDELRAQLKKED